MQPNEKTMILIINPGASSTKVALYDLHTPVWQENIEHSASDLCAFRTVFDQIPFRLPLVLDALKRHGCRPEDLACVMSRGGVLPPLPSGAYAINDEMLDVLEHRPMNHHASNAGAAIALAIARPLRIGAYIYDPVTTDEMIDMVRITGLSNVLRHGQGHNLNMRAAALKYCRDSGRKYAESNLIIAHLGQGITLSLHEKGRIVDMISDDEGPFSPERAGLIPDFKLVKIICEQGLTRKEAMTLLQHQGGLVSHLGTSSARQVEKMVQEGDEHARLVFEAMALAVAESIGRLAVVACGSIDQIILTGGIAYSKIFTGWIEERVRFLAPVTVIPGENEMQALADGAARILLGEEKAKEYKEPETRFF